MIEHNASNERIKRQYFTFLKEAKRQSEPSVDAVAAALDRFEVYTRRRDFKKFHIEQATNFKKHLAAQKSPATGKPLSKATLRSTLGALKGFFLWLAGQPGYKSRISYSDAEYFNLSEKDSRVATARRPKRFPTLDQILHTLDKMPDQTEVECRDRAVVAFTLLTGARDRAIASLKLKHVDMEDGSVFQDAREVQTKFSKTFTTWFFPVGDRPRQIVSDWVNYLKTKRLWGNDDPLFPATQMVLDEAMKFQAVGLERKHWSNAGPIRRIFRTAFTAAGLPYFNPHSFRDTLVQLGEQICPTPEQFKAWSQNLGHEQVLTTLTSYGEVASSRQAEIIRGLAVGKAKDSEDSVELTAQTFLRVLQENGVLPPP